MKSHLNNEFTTNEKNINYFAIILNTIFGALFIFMLYRVLLFFDLDITRYFNSFSTVFVSLVLQAIPFLLLGTLISSIIKLFVSDDKFVKLFPENSILSFVAAILSGFVIPLCDCAVVPVASRLIKKGVPPSAAICFMLASPIVNPITLMATYFAFPDQPQIMFIRVSLGVIVALLTGISISIFADKNISLEVEDTGHKCGCHGKISGVFTHAVDEFFTVGRFFLVGAAISSIVQVLFPKDILTSVSMYPVISVFIMIMAAFFMSICSTADAFIARSFATTVPMHGVMGFMVLGPLLDIKNVLMMIGCFQKKFVFRVSLSIGIIGFIILAIFTSIIY